MQKIVLKTLIVYHKYEKLYKKLKIVNGLVIII